MALKCLICNADLSEFNEYDRISHENGCLDKELENSFQASEAQVTNSKPQIVLPDPSIDYDLSGMPDYESMSTADLKKHLDNYGMKKTLEPKQARTILKETWIYIKHGVFPNALAKYV